MTFKKALYTALSLAFMVLVSAAPSLAGTIHRVAPGETLESIALESDAGVSRILAANPYIESPYTVFPGQVLVLPDSRPGSRYTVKTGDTLEGLAADQGLDPEDLASYNSLETNSIVPGQVIILPPAPEGETPPVKSGQDLSPDKGSAPKKQENEYNIPRLRALFPGLLFSNGNADRKVVALTFDDGPDDVYTPRILKILDDQNVKATFFLVGSRVSDYSQVVRDLVDHGHQVAGHGWSHGSLRAMARPEVEEELDKTARAIRDVTGLEPLMFRPPYGELSPGAMAAAAGLGCKAVIWSADSFDWHTRSADRVLESALADTRRGSIILMHSTGVNLDATVTALPDLINTLRAQGYSFVTVAGLLGASPYRE